MEKKERATLHVLPIISITISTTSNILTMNTTLLTILISIDLNITCLFWLKTQITQIEQQNQKLTETSDPEKWNWSNFPFFLPLLLCKAVLMSPVLWYIVSAYYRIKVEIILNKRVGGVVKEILKFRVACNLEIRREHMRST